MNPGVHPDRGKDKTPTDIRQRRRRLVMEGVIQLQAWQRPLPVTGERPTPSNASARLRPGNSRPGNFKITTCRCSSRFARLAAREANPSLTARRSMSGETRDARVPSALLAYPSLLRSSDCSSVAGVHLVWAGGSGAGRVPDGFGFQVGEDALEAGGLGPVLRARAQDALEVLGGGNGQVIG